MDFDTDQNLAADSRHKTFDMVATLAKSPDYLEAMCSRPNEWTLRLSERFLREAEYLEALAAGYREAERRLVEAFPAADKP